jgi:hypothetical protein
MREADVFAFRMKWLLRYAGGRKKLLAMITVVADESGPHQGSLVLTLGCYLGTEEEWGSVKRAVSSFQTKIGRVFHASDCATGYGDYAEIGALERNQITKELIGIANLHKIDGFWCGVSLKDYEELIPREDDKWSDWLDYVYRVAFGSMVIDLCRHVSKHFPGEQISIMMEQSEDWYPKAARQFIEMKQYVNWKNRSMLGTIAPYSKKEAPPLAVADALAYEAYLYRSRKLYNPNNYKIRGSLLALVEKQKSGKFWTKKGLLQLSPNCP